MSSEISLKDLKPGESGIVKELLSEGPMRRRLLDIGLIEGTLVECIGRSPAGDPLSFLIRGAVIAIRTEDAAKILLQAVSPREEI